MSRQTKEAIQDYYQRNKDRSAAYSKEYSQRDYVKEKRRERKRNFPEKQMLASAKIRAKEKNVPFSIDLEDIVIPSHCPILGIPLKMAEGKPKPSSPALDRINNTLGYVKGNVRVISHKINTNKGDLTLEQVGRLLQYMKKEI